MTKPKKPPTPESWARRFKRVMEDLPSEVELVYDPSENQLIALRNLPSGEEYCDMNEEELRPYLLARVPAGVFSVY